MEDTQPDPYAQPYSPPAQHRWKKGQSGNPNGRKKGSLDWAVIVRKLLSEPKMLDAVMRNYKKPEWLDKLPAKRRDAGHAIAMSMIIEALNGNQKAAEWLRKTGFGDMHKIEMNNPVENILQQYGLENAVQAPNATKYIDAGEPSADKQE